MNFTTMILANTLVLLVLLAVLAAFLVKSNNRKGKKTKEDIKKIKEQINNQSG